MNVLIFPGISLKIRHIMVGVNKKLLSEMRTQMNESKRVINLI